MNFVIIRHNQRPDDSQTPFGSNFDQTKIVAILLRIVLQKRQNVSASALKRVGDGLCHGLFENPYIDSKRIKVEKDGAFCAAIRQI